MAEVALDKLAERLVEKFKIQSDQHTLSGRFFARLSDRHRRRSPADPGACPTCCRTPSSTPPAAGLIRVAGRYSPSQVTVSVDDQGPGIAQADLPHVFERFYRANSDLTKRVKGTGLGLYLAKAVVEAHGGQISVRIQRPAAAPRFRSRCRVEIRYHCHSLARAVRARHSPRL